MKKKTIKQDHKTMADGVKVYCNYDELLPVTKLIPHPKNPNKHPDKQIELLSKIIQKNGWRDRIVISNRSGMIVKGHGRYQAAIRAGLSKVPVEYQNYMTDADEIKDLIADNKIAELSEVDDEQAFELIGELGGDGFNIELAGFNLDDFQDGWGGNSSKKNNGEGVPEIEFSEELLLEHNYIVLYFDNEFDWNVAKAKFGLKKVKDLIERKGAPVGIGRVLNGAEWVEKL